MGSVPDRARWFRPVTWRRLHKISALAAVSVLALAACNTGGTTSAAPSGSGTAAGGQPAACKDKKGTSSTEIHVYSSLPRQGTNTEQTNTLVEQIKQVLDGQKIGRAHNFDIAAIGDHRHKIIGG